MSNLSSLAKKAAAAAAGVGGVSILTGDTAQVTPPADVVPSSPLPAQVKDEKKKALVDSAVAGATQTADPVKKTIARATLPGLILDKSALPIEAKFKTLQESMDKISSEIPQDRKTEFTRQAEGLRQTLADARKRADEAKASAMSTEEKQAKITGYAEAAELIGHALAQLGAGVYGNKTGVDLSGVKFNRRDWSQDYKRIQDRLKTRLDEVDLGLTRTEKDVEKESALVRADLSKEEEKAQEAAKEKKQLLMSKLKTELDSLKASKDVKNEETRINFQTILGEYNRATDQINKLDLAEDVHNKKMQEILLEGNQKVLAATTKAAASGEDKAIKAAQEKATNLNLGISALYAAKSLKTVKDRQAKIKEAVDRFVKVGLDPVKINKIINETTAGWIFPSLDPEAAAQKIKAEAATQTAAPVQATTQPSTPTATPAGNTRAAVDKLASMNPGLPRPQLVAELKKAGKIPQDYAD